MTKLLLDKETILKRISGIQEEMREMENLAKLSFKEFTEGTGFKLAQYHLHRALEGVFILARTYSGIILNLPILLLSLRGAPPAGGSDEAISGLTARLLILTRDCFVDLITGLLAMTD